MKTEQLAAILLKYPGLDVMVADGPGWGVGDPVEAAGVGYAETGLPITDEVELFDEDEIRDDEDPISAIPSIFKKVFVITPQN